MFYFQVERQNVLVCNRLGVVPRKMLHSHWFWTSDRLIAIFINMKTSKLWLIFLRALVFHTLVFHTQFACWSFWRACLSMKFRIGISNFCPLPFEFSTTPYIFTKIQRPIVVYWRSDNENFGVLRWWRYCRSFFSFVQIVRCMLVVILGWGVSSSMKKM